MRYNRTVLSCQRLASLIRKDLMVILRSRGMVANFFLPILLVAGILPLLVFAGSGVLIGAPGTVGQWIVTFIERLPRSITQEVASLSYQQQVYYVTAVYYFAPFFLLKPASIGIALSGTAIVGEKSGRTLETLLMSPVSDAELLLSKVVCCSIPGTLATWVGFFIYSIVINVVTGPVMNGTWFPVPLWFVLIFLLVPLLSLLVASLTLAFSLKLRHPGDATQLGNLILFPLIALFFSQAFGWLHFDLTFITVTGAVLIVLNLVLFAAALRVFNRKRLAESGF